MFLSFWLLIVRCPALKPPGHWVEPGLHVGMDTHSAWGGCNGHSWGVGEIPVVAETGRQLQPTGTCWPWRGSLPCHSTADRTSSGGILAVEPLIPLPSIVSTQPTAVLSPEAVSPPHFTTWPLPEQGVSRLRPGHPELTLKEVLAWAALRTLEPRLVRRPWFVV